MPPPLLNRRWMYLLAFMAGTLYIASSYRAYFPGAINDDAAFILAARSLTQGRYVSLYTIAPVPETLYWPGYPLFLTFFVRWCAPHWRLLCWVSILLTLAALFLLERLTRPLLPTRLRWIFVAAFALHPLTVKYAGMIIAEPLFIALLLWYFLRLQRLLHAASGWGLAGQGLLLASIILVRPIGVMLVPATLIAYGISRKWGTGLFIVVIGLALSGLFPVWIFHHRLAQSSYLGFWQSEAPLLVRYLGEHVFRVFTLLFTHFFLGLQIPNTPIGRLLCGIGILAGTSLCLRGFMALLRDHPAEQGIVWATGLFVCGLLGVHSFWLSLDHRFFWPMMPFGLLFLVAGAASLPSLLPSKPAYRNAVLVLPLVWLGLQLKPSVSMAAVWRSHPLRPPLNTFQWIQAQTPPESFFLGPQPTLALYTGRRGMTVYTAASRDAFRRQLLNDHLSYAVSLPFTVNMLLGNRRDDLNLADEKNKHWLSQWPEAFPLVYTNELEGAALYRLLPDPTFQKAYDLYESAVADLQEGRTDHARKTLLESLRIHPRLGSSWTAIGILDYQKSHYSEAESAMRRAIAINPEDTLALLHLARISRMQGALKEAAIYYQQTRAAIQINGDYDELLPKIAREIEAIPRKSKG